MGLCDFQVQRSPKSKNLRIFQHTPKGTYPKPEKPTVYDSEFVPFGGSQGCLGYAPGVCFWG